MECRIAGNHCPAKQPFLWSLHEFGAKRILQNVVADARESIAMPLLVLEHMIVRLMLELLRCEPLFQMRPQESHAVSLVGIPTQPHPDQMQVIGHKAIKRTQQSLARRSVQNQFTERGLEFFAQPSTTAVRHRKRPMDDRIALIKLTRQTGQIKRPVDIGFIHSSLEICTPRASRNPERLFS